MTTPWCAPIVLEGQYCRLEPLSLAHHDALVTAVNDGNVWNACYALVPRPENMRKEIEYRLALQEKGQMLPFTVIHKATGVVIGMTGYVNIDAINQRLDIGFTWYAKSYQRTPVNTDCKLMLLAHAFDVLNCIAVGFRADYLNRKSRQAIERIGAKYEGMLRNYARMPDGTIRDMCLYSILPHEWPRVKIHLRGLSL